MKINSVQQNESISKYVNNVGKDQARPSVSSKISDTVELSEGAQKYSAFVKAARSNADKMGIDEDAKVAEITAKIKILSKYFLKLMSFYIHLYYLSHT